MVSAPTVSVVGGGVIGLAVAWRLAEDGRRVTVHDPDADRPASTRAAAWVAGGMLTPITEGATPAEDAGYALGASSLRRWPVFAAELELAAGMPSGLRPKGSLAVGFDPAGLDVLASHAERLAALGGRFTVLSGAQCRAIEPLLSPGVLGGLAVPADASVDNRAVLDALRQACLRRGVTLDPHAVTDLADLRADQLVVAAGAWSAALVPSAAVRPVQGEILRLRRPAEWPQSLAHTIRAALPGGSVYLVPRDDGVVVGATQRNVGFDTAVTAAGAQRLLAHAIGVLPVLGSYLLAEVGAGLRPMTPDGLPLIGRLDGRTVLATGHGRNGFLLAPLTADLVVAELSGQPMSETVAGLVRPNRFADMASNARIGT